MAGGEIRQRLGPAAQRGAVLALSSARALLRALAALAHFIWPFLRAALRAAGTALVALILIFEEWGWRPLAELLSLLARFRPWARIEGWIASLPPYGALAVFVLPSTLLFPVKLLALMLLAKGQAILAGLMLAGAKIAGTAFVARIFMLTKPALMRIGWFVRLYEAFMPWKEALLARVRASWVWRYGRVVKTWVKREAKKAWRAIEPRLDALTADWRPRVRATWERIRSEIASLTGRGSRIG